jgi:hypothetical protein
MPKEFSEKIEGKTVKVTPATHKAWGGDAWGAQVLCPWCGKTLRQAADLIFNYVKLHYKREHKK